MKPFSTTLTTDDFKRAVDALYEDARRGLAETRELHRQLLLARAGVDPRR